MDLEKSWVFCGDNGKAALMQQTINQIHLKPNKEASSMLKRSGASTPVALNETHPYLVLGEASAPRDLNDGICYQHNEGVDGCISI